MLGNVLMLCTFVFFIFGVVAVQLWAGVLRQRCYLNSLIDNTSTSLSLDSYYGQYDDDAVICTLKGDQERGSEKVNCIRPFSFGLSAGLYVAL